jgi:serine/threonine protein phosphatase PrpC
VVKSGWSTPQGARVIGAAHRRRGQPCQDALLCHSLNAPSGEVVQLITVADGHGGARYPLSDVGSRLACEQTLLQVSQALQDLPLEQHPAWSEQLAGGLAEAIHSGWRQACAAHWQSQGHSPATFSPLPYGCTLGLLVLTPGWWAVAGVGDWDLVQISADGIAQLISEEEAEAAPGESTASLCLQEAPQLWRQRSVLHRLTAGSAPFALLLSTDGIRKSCATDADFLTLSRHWLEQDDPQALSTGLEQVSAQGSGDDVTLAISRWSGFNLPPVPPAGRPRRRRLVWLAGLGLPAAGTAAALLWTQPWRGRPPAPTPPIVLQLEVQRLCQQPDRIAGALSLRRAQFERLRRPAGPASARARPPRQPDRRQRLRCRRPATPQSLPAAVDRPGEPLAAGGPGRRQDAGSGPPAMSSAYALGTALRQHILAALQRGQVQDSRLLQALVGDLCGADHSDLLPALRYLVLSPAFSSALGQREPLGSDSRLEWRLRQELEQVFAPAICQRLEPVLRGLLALPAAAPQQVDEQMPEDRAEAKHTQPIVSSSPPPPAPRGSGLVAVLGFLAGALAVGLAGVLAWFVWLNRAPQQSSAPTATPPTAPTEAVQPATPPQAPNLDQAELEKALATVQELYQALSQRDANAVRQRVSSSAADQFEPSVYEPMQRVEVSDLREINRRGATVELEGVVTYVYSDGTSQSESRSFSVDTSSTPALVTASGFGQVLKPRN